MADGYGALIAPRLCVRTLFISDLHLGTRDCQADRLLALLDCCETDQVYLVGDVVDGWRLKARWYWPASHDAIVRCLLRKQQDGTQIRYIPGNHDEFLRHSVGLRLGGIAVMAEAVHRAADGRRYLVIHGDDFDPVVRRMRRLTALGIWVYAAAVLAHDALSRWRRRRGARRGRSRADIAAFEAALAREAQSRQLDGVVCGHIHQPALHDTLGVRYVNTGDWIDACTAVVEHHDGALELLRWPRLKPMAALPPLDAMAET